MQADLLKKRLEKVTGPSQRREMAEHAVARRGTSIALACRAFGVSEACYRYGPKLRAENEAIADLLTGLTDARKTWGGRPVFAAFAQRDGASMEPQTRLSHWLTGDCTAICREADLLRAGVEPADQAPEAVDAGQT